MGTVTMARGSPPETGAEAEAGAGRLWQEHPALAFDPLK